MILWFLFSSIAGACATVDGPSSGVAPRTGFIKSNGILGIGDPAPPIHAVDADGKAVSVSVFLGKPLLLDFGSVFCMNCRNTIVYMEKLRNRFEPEGLTVVMVAVDGRRAAEPARQYWDEVGARFPIVFDDAGKTAELYGVDVIPYQFLVDRQGVIRVIHTGYDEKMIPDKSIRDVLSR